MLILTITRIISVKTLNLDKKANIVFKIITKITNIFPTHNLTKIIIIIITLINNKISSIIIIYNKIIIFITTIIIIKKKK